MDDSTGKWGRALGSPLQVPTLWSRLLAAAQAKPRGTGKEPIAEQRSRQSTGCCRLLCQTHPASREAGQGNQWQRRRWDRVISDDPHSPATRGRVRVLEPGHPQGRPPASTALADPTGRARYEGGDGSTLKGRWPPLLLLGTGLGLESAVEGR